MCVHTHRCVQVCACVHAHVFSWMCLCVCVCTCTLKTLELEFEESRGHARKAVDTRHLVPRREAAIPMHPAGGVLGREAQSLLTVRKEGCWGLDQGSPVLQGRWRACLRRWREWSEKGVEIGGMEKCTGCREGISAPGLTLSLGKEAAVGTVLTGWNRSPRRRPMKYGRVGIRQ